MARHSNEEVEAAKQVLRSHYYGGVESEAADLVRAYYDGEWHDDNGLIERVHEMAESAMTYTSDQWLTLFVSDNTATAFDEALDMGTFEHSLRDRENRLEEHRVVSGWGYSTYYDDLQEAFDSLREYLPDYRDYELDELHRLEWLAHHHGRLLINYGPAAYYLIGTPDPGQQAGLRLGVVRLSFAGEPGRPTERMTVRAFLTEFLETDSPAELDNSLLAKLFQAVADDRRDEQAWRTLVDALQEAGLGEGFGPDAKEPTVRIEEEGHGGRRLPGAGGTVQLAPGEEVSLLEFLEQNRDDEELCIDVRTLNVGQNVRVGGGAAPFSVVTRVT